MAGKQLHHYVSSKRRKSSAAGRHGRRTLQIREKVRNKAGSEEIRGLLFCEYYVILTHVVSPQKQGRTGLARRSPPINVPSVRDLPLVKQN